MKKLTFFVSLLVVGCSFPDKHIYGVLITQEHYTHIYNSPNGVIMDSIVNKPTNDELYVMEIFECKNDWFFVDACLPLSDSISYRGWIRYPDVGIYMKDFHNVKIYDHPSYDSSVKLELENAEWGPYVVIGVKGMWVQIELDHRGLKVVGWLPPENQSSNPYTTEC